MLRPYQITPYSLLGKFRQVLVTVTISAKTHPLKSSYWTCHHVESGVRPIPKTVVSNGILTKIRPSVVGVSRKFTLKFITTRHGMADVGALIVGVGVLSGFGV